MTGRSTLTQQTVTNDFDSAARRYYVGCAKHVQALAPLPEFVDAIAVLEAYDESPDEDNLDWLKEVYEALKSDKQTRRDYGYTAVGEFYNGLLSVIEHTIEGIDVISMSETTYFAEAAWCAGRAINRDPWKDVAGAALRREHDFQEKLFNELFD
jgi:hypothetical protein